MPATPKGKTGKKIKKEIQRVKKAMGRSDQFILSKKDYIEITPEEKLGYTFNNKGTQGTQGSGYYLTSAMVADEPSAASGAVTQTTATAAAPFELHYWALEESSSGSKIAESMDEIQELLRLGVIDETTDVWVDGWADWRALGECAVELGIVLTQQEPVDAQVDAPAAPNSESKEEIQERIQVKRIRESMSEGADYIYSDKKHEITGNDTVEYRFKDVSHAPGYYLEPVVFWVHQTSGDKLWEEPPAEDLAQYDTWKFDPGTGEVSQQPDSGDSFPDVSANEIEDQLTEKLTEFETKLESFLREVNLDISPNTHSASNKYNVIKKDFKYLDKYESLKQILGVSSGGKKRGRKSVIKIIPKKIRKKIRKIYKGPRGGTYYKSKGRKIYIK